MDPAEAKNAEATVQPPTLPVVRNWKRISIVSGASVIVLAVVFWVLFGNEITTDDAQVDGYITTVSPRVSGDVVKLWVNDNARYTRATRSLTLILVIIKPLTTKRRLRTMWRWRKRNPRKSTSH